ncbi:MAG: zinc-ribbon domain-containing protein [Alphaproteobacteria bacterium]
MILTCPNCSSRFLLSAQVLAPEGRRVRCSACEEEWFQQPDPDELLGDIENEIEEIPESVKPIPEGSSVLALPGEGGSASGKTGRANLAGYIGALIIGAGIFGALAVSKDAIVKSWLPAAAFYEMIGMNVTAPGEGLVFDKIKAQQNPGGQIVVEGNLINLTNHVVRLTAIEVSLRNEEGEEIHANLTPPPFDEMKPETTLPFKSVHNVKKGRADHVQLRFVLETPEEEPEEKETKTVSKDAGNTQALHADDHAEPPAAAAH